MPAAEVAVGPELVQALLAEQFPQLAHLPLRELSNGWDNVLFRLGDDLLVRLPRRSAAAVLVEHEQRWVPQLAPSLPLPVPVPLHHGRPGCGYPWLWSVVTHLAGTSAAAPDGPELDQPQVADALGSFLGALHRPAPPDAPRNPFRGGSLSPRTERVLEQLGTLTPDDGRRGRAVWSAALDAAPWSSLPVWLHGDVHPANLLVDDVGRLCAVLDFGDLTSGDPATDVAVGWMLLDTPHRMRFLDVHAAAVGTDRDLVRRARGWALALGLVFATRSADNAAMRRIGIRTLRAVLSADPSDG